MAIRAWPSIVSEVETNFLSGFGKRYILAILSFFGICLNYAMRFSLSIVIVAMVNSTKPLASVPFAESEFDSDNFTQSLFVSEPASSACPPPRTNLSTSTKKEKTGDLNWDESTVGLILGSFFWGYISTQIIGGFLAQKYGGKWLFGLGQAISALAGLFIPVLAYQGPQYMKLIRVVQGLCGGVTFPAAHVLISRWIPPEERGKFATFIYAGMPFGSALTLLTSGYISHYLGWASVFYITGVITFIWFIVWSFVIYDSPLVHPTISDSEFKLIHMSIGDQRENNTSTLRTPWSSIFRSWPVWAIFLTHPTSTWGHYTMLILIPTYLKTALHFDLKSNSWISACPHIASWLTSILLVKIGDYLMRKKLIRTGTARKINMTICLWGSAGMMIGVAYAGCNYKLAVVLLTLAVGCVGGVYGGVLCNHIDIAPNFAGILLGMSNTLATIPGFLSPSIAGFILQGNPSVEQWKKVFYLGAIIHIIGNVIYLLFGSGEEQPWNRKQISSKNQITNTVERD